MMLKNFICGRAVVALAGCVLALGLGGCGGDSKGSPDTGDLDQDVLAGDVGDVGDVDQPAGHFVGQLDHTILFGEGDNAEVAKLVPGTTKVLLVASKARKVVLLETAGKQLTSKREKLFFPNDATESELTNLAVSPDGTWAVATRTILVTDGGGQQTDCGGQLVFFDATDTDAFGTILAQVDVGPMPDAVAVSDDGLWVASADERDGPEAWGKCDVPGELASISILSLAAGPAAAQVVHTITLVDGDTGPREPESLVFSKDNDLLVCTLQDSHEVLFVRVSALAGDTALDSTSDQVKIVRLPDDSVGAGPWPDGVGRVVLPSGDEYFVTAGEWNDTFTVLDGTGAVISNNAISPSDIPEDLPRLVDEGYPLFSPDSVAPFTYNGKALVAFTLRHSGAVAVYDLSAPEAPVFDSAVGVGKNEAGTWDENGSTIRPEGIAAAPDGAFIVTANEGESSASLVTPAE